MSRTSISRPPTRPFLALTEFAEKLPLFSLHPEQDSVNTGARPAFVRRSQLRAWLADRTREGDAETTNIDRLVEDACQKRGGRYATLAPNNAEDILANHCLVLSLLLEANEGHLIYELQRQQITDQNLCDIHPKDLHERLWTALESDNVDDVAKHDSRHRALFHVFSHRRWAYRPHVFRYNAEAELSSPTIIPIYKRQRVNRGGIATIYQLCVPEEYLDDNMKRNLKGSSFDLPNVGKCYNLAVKTFRESSRPDDDAKELFQQECEAYKHLRGHPGMVRYLGAFTHRVAPTQIEHNILLEYGDYDLAEYFLFSPPVHPVNVCNLWHDLFDVVDALAGLHKFRRVRRGREEDIRGWHNDIKPDNILSVKGQLKLTDPGFAGFAKQHQDQNVPRTSVTLMASTYGPPESCFGLSVTEMPQAADIWSIGGVLSEAATWLILGPPGLTQYRNLRKDAIRRANQDRRRDAPNNSSSSRRNTVEGDHFHNGNSVLPEIQQWHVYLRANLRRCDHISGLVLNIIDNSLLRSDPRERFASAEGLSEELANIRRSFPRHQASGFPPAVESAATSVEARLKLEPIQALLGESISIQLRKALKSQDYLEFPRDGIAQLSDMIKERVDVMIAKPPNLSLTTVRNSRDSTDMAYMTSPADMTAVTPSKSYEMSQASPQQSVESTFPTTKPAKRASRYPTDDIFDVHYPKNEPKGLGAIKQKFARAKDKDAILKEHYHKRDIKFVVDNSAGMISDWQKARFVLEKVSQKAARIDDDGMDLEFTNRTSDTFKIRDKYRSQDIEGHMDKFKPTKNDVTDMATKLRSIFNQWLNTHESFRKCMSIIVLTDGRWEGMSNYNEVEDTIVVFDGEMSKLRGAKLNRRRVSIQFISFGDDARALYRLRHLDNDLIFERNIEDIVDTEPWDGYVYKMLLGSHVADMDHLDEEPARDNTSSSATHRHNTYSLEQATLQNPHWTPTRRERSSLTNQIQIPIQSIPHIEQSLQPSHYTQRESLDQRLRQPEPGGYYRSVT